MKDKSDRELLELAAKAAGNGAVWYQSLGMGIDNGSSIPMLWRPRTDDGDSQRLAVDLGLEVYHTINDDRWTVFVGYPKDQRIIYVMEEYGDDKYDATRRAILGAAAAIGEAMP